MPWKGSFMSAYDLVRVRDGANEVTVARAFAEAQGLAVLSKPALDEYGRALPAKPVTDKAGDPVAVTVKEK